MFGLKALLNIITNIFSTVDNTVTNLATNINTATEMMNQALDKAYKEQTTEYMLEDAQAENKFTDEQIAEYRKSLAAHRQTKAS